MAKLPIEANICEEGGAYYQVRLSTVPRVGELIELFSFVDQEEGKPPEKRQYEVVQVKHDLHDVSRRNPRFQDGHHFVHIFVQPAASKFFSND